MPVLANFEAIWVVIIAVSVIAQIVKGLKKIAAQQAPGSKPHPPMRTSNSAPSGNRNGLDDNQQVILPRDALQAFLRNLAGDSALPSQPVRVIKPPAHLPKRPTTRAFTPPPPAARPITLEIAPPVTLDKGPHRLAGTESLAEELKQELRDRKNLRKAIILREVIERPPLALR